MLSNGTVDSRSVPSGTAVKRVVARGQVATNAARRQLPTTRALQASCSTRALGGATARESGSGWIVVSIELISSLCCALVVKLWTNDERLAEGTFEGGKHSLIVARIDNDNTLLTVEVRRPRPGHRDSRHCAVRLHFSGIV